ncbi:MAG: helix-hairpin-helix domain-containing protein [Bacillota bacterium]
MLRDVFDEEIKVKKGLIALLILALVGTTSVIGFLLAANNEDIIISKSEENINPKSSDDIKFGTADKSEPQTTPVEEIEVYVVGEVNKPGVVTLKKGQIIKDAIDLAGGPTKDADLENINLAYELKENVMLRIRSKKVGSPNTGTSNTAVSGKDASNKTAAGSKTPSSKAAQSGTSSLASGNSNKEQTLTGTDIIKDSGGSVVGENENKDSSSAKVNINKATIDELDTLPGVGPSTAAKIISYREKNGGFKKIEDIMEVPGIGESKFNSLKDFITVE